MRNQFGLDFNHSVIYNYKNTIHRLIDVVALIDYYDELLPPKSTPDKKCRRANKINNAVFSLNINVSSKKHLFLSKLMLIFLFGDITRQKSAFK